MACGYIIVSSEALSRLPSGSQHSLFLTSTAGSETVSSNSSCIRPQNAAHWVEQTFTTLLYFIQAMVLYPEAMQEAQKELDVIVGHNRPPTFEDQEKLPYVQALVKEVLRWRPVGPMSIHPSMSNAMRLIN